MLWGHCLDSEVWVRAASDRSGFWQDSAQRQSVSPGDECITHSTIHKSLIFISMTLTGGIFILAWPSILQVGQKKKRERERESHQQHCLFGVFWFCYRLVISAAAAAAGCCHRDTQRHTFRHKTQSHSSCGITETQTGACASTHTNTHCNTFQAWCHSVAHMLPWPLCLWVREQWWVTTFLASRRVCFPKTVSSIL